MRIKACKGIAGTIFGVILIVVGGVLIAFPTPGIFAHPADGGAFLESVTRGGTRVYGLLAVLFGGGLIWLARWPRWGARRSAIEDYVWSLSQELSRHFGAKK